MRRRALPILLTALVCFALAWAGGDPTAWRRNGALIAGYEDFMTRAKRGDCAGAQEAAAAALDAAGLDCSFSGERYVCRDRGR